MGFIIFNSLSTVFKYIYLFTAGIRNKRPLSRTRRMPLPKLTGKNISTTGRLSFSYLCWWNALTIRIIWEDLWSPKLWNLSSEWRISILRWWRFWVTMCFPLEPMPQGIITALTVYCCRSIMCCLITLRSKRRLSLRVYVD